MERDARRPEPSRDVFVRGAAVETEAVTRIEGRTEQGHMAIKPMLVGDDMLCMEVHRAKGLVDPEHDHPDHESICYLVSGRMRVVIDSEEFEAGPGDCWIHRPGVPHFHEALEDCVQLEFKAPPRKTWG